MRCYLLRHGITSGNNRLSFNGCMTDDPLTQEGRDSLKAIEDVPEDAVLFASPMKRAVETAGIMFPGKEPIIIDGLKEMNFGVFEGKNHEMLDGDPVYQAWLDSGGEMQIPEGESIRSFIGRIVKAFNEAAAIAGSKGSDTMYIVAHGGTIMAAMSALTGGDYLSFLAPNGAGYLIELETDDAGIITSATAYDRFFGGLRDGSGDWRPPVYTPSDSVDR